MADFRAIKRQFDNVQNTYVSVEDSYRARAYIQGKSRTFSVTLIDTMLLMPGSAKSLAALGDLYRFQKLEPGARNGIPYIDRMDRLLADDPEHFEAYAIRDAEISARHVAEVWRFANKELELDLSTPPFTMGSLAVLNLLKIWADQRIDLDDVLDGVFIKIRKFDPIRRRYFFTKYRRHTARYSLNEALATACYHGGRNECFAYGPTIEGGTVDAPPFREYDLIGAYGVAMASIGMPEWQTMHDCTDATQYRPGVLGVARVRFGFPVSTRFPCLPIDAPDDHGLIYPLEGVSFATASEITVAMRLGAEIEILDGVIVAWRNDGCRPFKAVIQDLQQRRNLHANGSLQNEMFKQLANSLYGKLAQGVKRTSVFDTRTEGHHTIGPSQITNPYLAGYVSGTIRALISELLAGIPPNRVVISVTTDAVVTNAEIGEIDMHGPVASFLSAIKQDLTGDPALLETKFEARQLLPWRTRGIATLKTLNGARPKLARGGMREPPEERSPETANNWFAQRMLLRQPGDEWSNLEPMEFPKAHRTNADHIFREVWRRVNFEYDGKRQPIAPEARYVLVPGEDNLIVQYLSFDTAPWRTLEEFVEERDLFERWRGRHPGGDQLKTIADWRRWREYRDGDAASVAGVNRSSKKGVVDQARRLVIRAYRQREWGLPGGDYKTASARLTQAGAAYRTTEDDFKNAGRSQGGPTPEHLIPVDAAGIPEFIDTVLSIWPTFEWWKLVGLKPTCESLRIGVWTPKSAGLGCVSY
jgi:hypothetical protein